MPTLRGSYSSINRRLDEAEGRIAARPRPTCPTCAGWPDYPVYEATDAGAGAPGSSLLSRYHRAPPRGGWPESFTCGDCSRTPVQVFKIVYEDRALTGYSPGPRAFDD